MREVRLNDSAGRGELTFAREESARNFRTRFEKLSRTQLPRMFSHRLYTEEGRDVT